MTAAQAGAAVVRDMFGGALARFDKGGGDVATAADAAAEKAVLDVPSPRARRPAARRRGSPGAGRVRG